MSAPPGPSSPPPAVLGVDVGGTKISLCVADGAGRVVARTRIATRAHEGAPAVLARLVDAGRELLGGVRAAGSADVRGVGVVTPGVVGATSVQLAPNNAGWEDVALAATVGDGLGLPVGADNDAKGATAAEAAWGALAGVDDGVLLNLGTGISAGAVVGGRLLRGAHGAALEIAYQVPWTGPGEGFAAGRAPLEETFSGAGLAAAATALLGRPAGAADVFAAMAAAGDAPGEEAALADLGRRALDVAVRAVADLVIALDPEVVAVSGGMLRSAELITGPLAAALAALVPFPPALVGARFGEHAPLAGACLVGYRAAGLAPPPDLDLDRPLEPDLEPDPDRP